MLRLADCGPVAAGAKVTLTVQDAPTAKPVQLFVCAKLAAPAPAIPTLLTISVAVPMLVTVTGWAALVVPTL